MRYWLIILALCGLTINACSKEDPEVPNEEELITTLTYVLTPTGGGSSLSFTFQDLDGDGGNAPIITVDTLSANTTYNGTLTLLNETESPADNITAEVQAEAEEHQFFFSSTLTSVVLSYNDLDGNNLPVGLSTTLQTGAPASGQLSITLRHEPDKLATGVSAGEITNAGGETDISVTFPIYVE